MLIINLNGKSILSRQQRRIPVGWWLCVCYKSWLKHGIPPHEFGSVGTWHPHSCNVLWFLQMHDIDIANGSHACYRHSTVKWSLSLQLRDLKSKLQTLMISSLPRGKHLKSISQSSWRKLSYNWVMPDSKLMQKRAISSARCSIFWLYIDPRGIISIDAKAHQNRCSHFSSHEH